MAPGLVPTSGPRSRATSGPHGWNQIGPALRDVAPPGCAEGVAVLAVCWCVSLLRVQDRGCRATVAIAFAEHAPACAQWETARNHTAACGTVSASSARAGTAPAIGAQLCCKELRANKPGASHAQAATDKRHASTPEQGTPPGERWAHAGLAGATRVQARQEKPHATVSIESNAQSRQENPHTITPKQRSTTSKSRLLAGKNREHHSELPPGENTRNRNK